MDEKLFEYMMDIEDNPRVHVVNETRDALIAKMLATRLHREEYRDRRRQVDSKHEFVVDCIQEFGVPRLYKKIVKMGLAPEIDLPEDRPTEINL